MENPSPYVAFNLDDAAKYEIFLDARRRRFQARGMTPAPLDPEWMPLVGPSRMRNASCSSAPASRSTRECLRTVSLLKKMADELGITEELSTTSTPTSTSPRPTATPKSRLPASSVTTSATAAPGIRPSIAHYLLMSLPIRFIVTTHFTTACLRRPSDPCAASTIRIVDNDHLGRTGYRDGLYVIEFHGDMKGDVVSGRDDYDAFFHQRPAMAIATRRPPAQPGTFFFVGYGLRDPNFRQIYCSKIDLMLHAAPSDPAFATTLDQHPKAHVAAQYRRASRCLPRRPASSGRPDGRDRTPPDRVPRPPRRRSHRPRQPLPRVPDAPSRTASRQKEQSRLAPCGRRSPSSRPQPRRRHRRRPRRPHDIAVAAGKPRRSLCQHGWRCPRGHTIPKLWLKLADQLPPDDRHNRERRRYTMSALRYADDLGVANVIRERLASMS